MVKIRPLLTSFQYWALTALMLFFVVIVCNYHLTIAIRVFLPAAALFLLRHFVDTPKALVVAIMMSSVLVLDLFDIHMFSQYWLRFGLNDILLGAAAIIYIVQQTLKSKTTETKDIFFGPFMLFLIAAVISSSAATNKSAVISLLFLLIAGYVFYRFIIFNFCEERDLVFLTMLSIFILILIVLWAFVNKSFTPVSTRAGIYSETRAGYIFAGPNSLAAVIVAFLPFCFILFTVRHTYLKLILGAIFLFGLYLLIHTYSRNGYISFILSTVLVLVLLSKTNPAIRFTLLFLIIVPVLFVSSAAISRLFTISAFSLDPSALFRLIMWKSALNEFVKHPFTGIGLANFYYVTRLYHSGFCHNLFLSTFTETGILGGIATIWLVIRAFKRLFSGINRLNAGFMRNLNACLIGAWVAFTISNIFDQAWFFLDRTAEIKFFWLLMGMTAVFVVTKEKYLTKARDASIESTVSKSF